MAGNNDDRTMLLSCMSCGSTFALNRAAPESTCPYCGGGLKKTEQANQREKEQREQETRDRSTPQTVKMIPFTVSREQAVQAFQRKNFEAQIPDPETLKSSLCPVYVPYTVFSGEVDCHLTCRTRKGAYQRIYETEGTVPFRSIAVLDSTGADKGRLSYATGYDWDQVRSVPLSSIQDAPVELTEEREEKDFAEASKLMEKILLPLLVTCGDTTLEGEPDGHEESFTERRDPSSIGRVYLPVWYASIDGETYAVNGQTGDLLPYIGVYLDARLYVNDLVPGLAYYHSDHLPYLRRLGVVSIIGFVVGAVMGMLLFPGDRMILLAFGVIVLFLVLVLWGSAQRKRLYRARRKQSEHFFLPVAWRTKAKWYPLFLEPYAVLYQYAYLTCDLNTKCRKVRMKKSET